MKLLFTFNTFADVFLCEKNARAAGFSCRAIPAPRSLGVSCDYAVEFQEITEAGVDEVLALLTKNNLHYTKVFRSQLTERGEIY